MDKKVMEKSKLKLLLNAEPFGFGPTAAVATFFPYLREKFEHIAYLGKKHTLDLQKNLPYDTIHDVTDQSDDEIQNVLSGYDIFFTALDFETAMIAKKAGLKVIIYDPLTWYWKDIVEIIGQSDLYLAQDFFGVKERLQKDQNLFPKAAEVVPPIVSQKRSRISTKHALVNLGGLQNPLWSVDNVEKYARVFIGAIKESLPSDEDLIIATSNTVAQRFNDANIRSYNRAEMYGILENTKYAFMTPGLGNIYDAAEFNVPTIWLPPANDSQGQQLDHLKKHKMSDGEIDWADLGKPVNYFDEQPSVLENIKDAVYSLSDVSDLKNLVSKQCGMISDKKESLTAGLLDEFGTGGAEKVADFIYEYSKSLQ